MAFLAAILCGYSATGSLMGGGIDGAGRPIQSAIIASLTVSRERTFYFSLFTFLNGILAAGGALAARFFSARTAFAAATLVAATGLLFLFPLRAPEFAGKSTTAKSRRVIGQFSLTGMLNGFAQGLITPFLIPFFVLVYSVAKDRVAIYGFIVGTLASFVLLAAVDGSRIGICPLDHPDPRLGAGLLALLPLTHHLAVALAIYVFTPALRVAALPAQQRALTNGVSPNETGRALGVNQVTRLGASSKAVVLTGVLFSESDIALPFFLYAGIMAVNIGLYFKCFGHSCLLRGLSSERF